jgi:hypothetical protein
MSYQLLSIEKIDTNPAVPFPCYFVMSTAPINIEDSNTVFEGAVSKEESSAALAEMTAYLKLNHADAEVLVMVHGYNTGRENVRKWYRDAAIDITRRYPKLPKGLVLIGYRWSSEQMNGDESGDVKFKRKSARQSLPEIMDYIYKFSFMGTIAGITVGKGRELVGYIGDFFRAVYSCDAGFCATWDNFGPAAIKLFSRYLSSQSIRRC